MTSPRLFLSFKQLYIVLLIMIVTGIFSYHFLDKPIATFAHAYPWGNMKLIFQGISLLGLGSVMFALAILGALVARLVLRKPVWEARCWVLFWALIVETVACLPLKMLFGRARPSVWFDEGLYGFFGFKTHAAFWSFPSGHAAVSMTFALCVGWFCPRFRIPALLLALCIALTRILLYRHYVSDVIAGAGLAILVVFGYTYFLQSCGWLKQAWPQSLNPLNKRMGDV